MALETTDGALHVHVTNQVETSGGGGGGSGETAWNFISAITRPANTTTYDVGDVLGDAGGWSVLTITGAAATNGGTGRLDDIVVVSTAYQTSPLPLMEFLIFSTVASPSAPLDGAASNFSDADVEYCEAVLTAQTWYPGNITAGSGGNHVGRIDPGQLPLRYKCGAGNTSIYLVCRFASAYVPISGEKFTIKGRGVQLS